MDSSHGIILLMLVMFYVVASYILCCFIKLILICILCVGHGRRQKAERINVPRKILDCRPSEMVSEGYIEQKFHELC